MALGEFELIGQYFSQCGVQRRDTLVGVGDDAALLKVLPDAQLLTSWATSYPNSTSDGETIASTVVAACLEPLPDGAQPCWLVLSLTVRGAEEPWLPSFAARLDALCKQRGMQLVGGDTTGGESCVELHCVAVIGS